MDEEKRERMSKVHDIVLHRQSSGFMNAWKKLNRRRKLLSVSIQKFKAHCQDLKGFLLNTSDGQLARDTDLATTNEIYKKRLSDEQRNAKLAAKKKEEGRQLLTPGV